MMSQIFEMQFLKWIYSNKPFYSPNIVVLLHFLFCPQTKELKMETHWILDIMMLHFIHFLCYLKYCNFFKHPHSVVRNFVEWGMRTRISSYFSMHLHFCWSFYFRFCLLRNDKITWWFSLQKWIEVHYFKALHWSKPKWDSQTPNLIATLKCIFLFSFYILQWRVAIIALLIYSINNNCGLRTIVVSTIDAINILLNDFPWTWWALSTHWAHWKTFSHTKIFAFRRSLKTPMKNFCFHNSIFCLSI